MSTLNIKHVNTPQPNTAQQMANVVAGLQQRELISLNQNNYTAHRKAKHQKFFMKLHEIARLSVAQVKDDQICYLMGVTRARLSVIRRMPEFVEIQEEEFNQHMGRLDGEIAKRADVIKTQLSNGVPTALETIRECMRGKDLRVRLASAVEWLDREGSITKGGKGGTAPGGFQIPASSFSDAQLIGDGIAKATQQVDSIVSIPQAQEESSNSAPVSVIDLNNVTSPTERVQ